MTTDPGPQAGPSFCGNCGATIEFGSPACASCGQQVESAFAPSDAPPRDYIPYCRSCGVGVPWEKGHACQRCGVAPLCDLHFRSATGMCLDCSAAPSFGSAEAVAQTAPGLSCRRCGGALFPDAEFCPNCGLAATVGSAHAIEYMGFWIRFAAFVADWIIVYVAAAIAAAIIGISMTSGDIDPQAMEDFSIAIENLNYSFLLLFCATFAVYSIVMTIVRGQTLGKMLLRIQVVDAEGNIPPWHKALVRELLRGIILLALFPLGLLYIWVGMDSHKRGPHDYLGGSFVVRKAPRRPRGF